MKLVLLDKELVERFQAGERAAFDELARRHYARAYAVAYRMLGDADLAADAVQASFVRAYRGLASYRQTAAFSTWLYRIVVNVCLDLSRRGYRVKTVSLDSDDRDEGLGVGETLADDSGTPEDALMRRERVQAVQAALLELTPHFRAVLVLYELEGLAYEDVARVLGVPVGTVKSRLNRARAAFAERFSAQLELFDIASGQTSGADKDGI